MNIKLSQASAKGHLLSLIKHEKNNSKLNLKKGYICDLKYQFWGYKCANRLNNKHNTSWSRVYQCNNLKTCLKSQTPNTSMNQFFE